MYDYQKFKKVIDEQSILTRDQKGRLLKKAPEISPPPPPNTIFYGEERYPRLLSDITDPPKQIYFRGNLSVLDSPLISMVGTRKSTQWGRSEARRMVRFCSKYGISTVSGLAFGIDSLVHRESLKCGIPTVAILPTGIGRSNITPKGHIELADKIVEGGGLLLSEVEVGVDDTPEGKYLYIMRNRIIAAISKTTVIVEAPIESGSLSTAGFASQYNRNLVVCLPGREWPGIAGNYKLLVDKNAEVVEPNYNSIKRSYGIVPIGQEDKLDKESSISVSQKMKGLSAYQKEIYQLLLREPSGMDRLRGRLAAEYPRKKYKRQELINNLVDMTLKEYLGVDKFGRYYALTD